ncbi:MAG: hypothetical protein ABW168_05120 [Sedimenticola sp.]
MRNRPGALQGWTNVVGGTTARMQEVERSRKPEPGMPGATFMSKVCRNGVLGPI